jgi:hypothetical protein
VFVNVNFLIWCIYCLFKDTFNTANDKLITEYVWASCTSYSVNTIPEGILGYFFKFTGDIYIQDISGGIVNILRSVSMDYSE